MPIGQGARNTIILGGLGRPQLFDTNVKATSIDEDIFMTKNKERIDYVKLNKYIKI